MSEQKQTNRWIAGEYGPKTIGIGRAGGPAHFLMRANHAGVAELLEDADRVVRALNLLDEKEAEDQDVAYSPTGTDLAEAGRGNERTN